MNIVLFLSLLTLWTGSLAAYLSSNKQQVLVNPAAKVVTWPVFIISFVVSSYLLMGTYSPTASILLCLSLVMLFWISVVLTLGHIKLKVAHLYCHGLIILLFISLLGA
ncbi:hypothetical protein [Psychrobium sp. 1_MG-2023]|uniref:hypothetical protein n=1 Tax=Psychrobium sp. 1_MG-2023 TaxID=3062624 RepID=UPI0027364C63|nr:hypothetical protein [Psychrobium sp. 1_MG-2023]MDP2560642.1 hypothetical protein [Psychrobium sp. 1_MG-2023]